MEMITEHYRDLNKQLHEDNLSYGKSGKKNVDDVMAMVSKFKTKDVLDYGCGKSTLQQQLPFKIKQYDPAILKYNECPSDADLVVCTDVMEHIEPDCLGYVLKDILEKANIAAFFVISTRPAVKFLKDGRNAHLIVKDYLWWLGVLSDVGFIVKNVSIERGEFKVLCLKGNNDA